MNARDNIIAIVIPLILGGFAASYAQRLRMLKAQTESWLQTKGFVRESKIVGWGKGRNAVVVYEYYTPETQVGSQICAPGCEDRDPEVYLRRYRVGDEVAVFFDPSEQSQSLLELPESRIVKAWSILSAIGFTFPLVYLLWLFYLE